MKGGAGVTLGFRLKQSLPDCNCSHALCLPQESDCEGRRSDGGLTEDEIELALTGEVECSHESICCWDGENLQKEFVHKPSLPDGSG